MADFVELGAEGVTSLTESKHFDRLYDKIDQSVPHRKKRNQNQPTQKQQDQYSGNSGNHRDYKQSYQSTTYEQDDQTTVPSNTGRRRHQNRLPSPEGRPPANWDGRKENRDTRRRDSQRSGSLDRESEVSERVIRAYETERDDPSRPAESVLSKRDLKKLNSRDAAKMSYAGGYGNTLQSPTNYDGRRANSQQPPRNKYYDDDDGSDYDERTGRRYKTTGRGYDDGYEDDRGYDREIVETERYRGPARDYDARRTSYGTSKGGNDQYGASAGAVTQYRRSTQEVDDYKSQRSRSRGRRESGRGRDRSASDSRSRSRSRSNEGGIRGKLDDTFDTSMKGLGAGLAGAVVGGLAGREFGHKHKQRDIIIGALIGGLGANVAENKWRDWKDEKEDKLRKDENKWEDRWDGRDGRSRSAMR